MTGRFTPQTGYPASTPLQREPNPRHRILVVDNDPYVCHLNAEVLIQHGYEVNAAEDGEAGWQELQANNYKLLITEHELPKLTGVTLLRKLRAARMALPVILASEKIPREELNRHSWLQIEATLLKPYSPADLLKTVEDVLRATDGRAQLALPGNWQSLPASGLRA